MRLGLTTAAILTLTLTGPMRRSGDFLIACVLLALTLPLILMTAVAIRLESPGPVLARRTRIGARGRPFQALSFRTTAQTSGQIRSIRQPTQLGHLLRSTRIDALPQLVNVLRGEMTLFETSLFD
jgi:lipopolysaccharide/colanic/teichoic acid biosynthesis glycosyltransferase